MNEPTHPSQSEYSSAAAITAYEGGAIQPGPIRQTSIDGNELEIEVDVVEGRPVIRRLTLTNPNDTGVTQTGLEQVARGAHQYVEHVVAAQMARIFDPLDKDISEIRQDFKKKRRRRVWGPDQLQEASRVFIEAERAGLPPRVAVSKHFTISASQAAKVLRMARDQGHFHKVEAKLDAVHVEGDGES